MKNLIKFLVAGGQLFSKKQAMFFTKIVFFLLHLVTENLNFILVLRFDLF